jgi:RimJ/RimL family protein N-acetyltransferase
LRLRAFKRSDLNAMAALYADPEVVRFWPRPPLRAEIARQIDDQIEACAMRGWGAWCAELHDGTFVGRVGLSPRVVEGRDEVEVGYAIAREHWGQGYATEAARASRDWAFEFLGVPQVVSFIVPDNLRSIAVARRNGMLRGGEILHAGLLHDVWAIARKAWLELP